MSHGLDRPDQPTFAASARGRLLGHPALRAAPTLLALTLLASCAERPPFVVLTIANPTGAGAGFATLHVGLAREALRRAKTSKSTFPLSLTLAAEKTGMRTVWVEVRAADQSPLARGITEARFRTTGTPTATVSLSRACAEASVCSDGLFCTGTESCTDGSCTAGTAPCASNVTCADTTCVETGGGAGQCSTEVFHERCDPGTYCNPLRGCVAGQGCIEDLDCADASTCNGEERCINLVCAPGIPPELTDQDTCTLDGCDDARTAGGLEAVFHVALESFDGSTCTIPGTGNPGSEGVCVASKGGCAPSECGDGVLGPNEACEDGNTNPNDTCAACRRTRWQPAVLSGLGYSAGVPSAASITPIDVAVDRQGNLLVADSNNHRVWRIDARTGLLSAIAGNGTEGYSGDGGPATSAELNYPDGVAVDGSGNVLIADTWNHRIRRVCMDGAGCTVGHISTVAGNGTWGYFGDSGPATSAQLASPSGIAVDGSGNLLIADSDNHRIRRVCLDGAGCTVGHISTLAGNGTSGFSGDSGPATSAQLNQPAGVAMDGSGNLLIADTANHRIRRVCLDGGGCTVGHISTLAGNGAWGFSGDDGPATSAQLHWPSGVAVDSSGNVLIADSNNHRIRRVCMDGADCTVGHISTFAGNGTAGFSGDDVPATSSQLSHPSGVAVDGSGNVLIGDSSNARIRRICVNGAGCTVGHISTLAGNGTGAFSGDGGPATSAQLSAPYSVAADRSGNVLIAESARHRIRLVCLNGAGCTVGHISTIAGNGTWGFSGDGGPATSAQLRWPRGVAVDGSGDLLIADSDNHRIRRVCLAGAGCTVGHISTLAGNGTAGFSGDGGPATSAQLNQPAGVAVDGSGNLLIADSYNHRIRRVCIDGAGCTVGHISTLAGNGTAGFSGDDVPATSARLNYPGGVAVDGSGNVVIGDSSNHRIRRVCMDGAGCTVGYISTLAGIGVAGFSGDGGPATSAWLNYPRDVAVDDSANVLIADSSNSRIRRVCVDGAGCTVGHISTLAGIGTEGFSGDGGPATSAQLRYPRSVALDGPGNVLIADSTNHDIRRVCMDGAGCTVGHISTLAGAVFPEGDGALGRSRLGAPRAMVLAHTWLFADGVSGRVRSIDLSAGVVGTVAGYDEGFAGEGAFALWSRLLLDPAGIALDAASETVFVSEYGGHTIRAMNVAATPWTISTLAGDLGSPGFLDDTGAAARFSRPSGLLFDAAARALLVADSGNHVIRSLAVDSGAVTTLAGTPRFRGFFGEGILANEALFNGPEALCFGNDGSLYLADTLNNRVRRIDSAGLIDTVLGDGSAASSGEGGPARFFPVDRPLGLAVDSFGNLFISSSTALKVVTAGSDNLATGEDEVFTLYGRPPRQDFPEPVTSCLAGIAVVAGDGGATDGRLYLLDACAGYLLQLDRVAL